MVMFVTYAPLVIQVNRDAGTDGSPRSDDALLSYPNRGPLLWCVEGSCLPYSGVHCE